MKKIRAVHIDDELDSIEVLRLLVEQNCPNIELVGYAQNTKDGIELIKQAKPQLVFLDIEMPGGDGFTLLEGIENPNFHTIMVTGYENYAIKAIRYSALDYLLKPLDVEELIRAVSKLNFEKMTADPRLAHLGSLIKNDRIIEDILVLAKSGYRKIKLAEIASLISQSGGYTIISLVSGTREFVTKPLSHFENLLPATSFYRINRSQLVNIDRVETYNATTGEVVLGQDKKMFVSTRKRSQFKRIFSERT